MLPRTWDAKQIYKSIPWLKAQNFNGHDIFIRPKGSQGYIFFDDLSIRTVQRMKDDGYSPALLVESSPLNYHGWLKISNNEISNEITTIICKEIAVKYGGDIDSADWRHYGRLAGFTNQKPEHINNNGKYPFVLLAEANGKICDKSTDLLESATRKLIQSEKEKIERQKQLKDSIVLVPKNLQPANAFFKTKLDKLYLQYGKNLDASRADWMIVTTMLRLGYSELSIKTAMEIHSPAITRRQNHAQNYIDITLKNAVSKG